MHNRFLFALALGLFMGTPALAAEQPGAQPTVSEQPIVPSIMSEFAQANPAWSSLPFHGQRTLGLKGCAVFSALIIARQVGYTGSVPEFTEGLRRLDSFDERGRIRWDRISNFAPLVAERLDIREQPAFDLARAEIRNGSYVTFQVRTPWTREHWVAGIGLSGDDIVIIDPAGGRREPFQRTYAIGYVRGLTVFRPLPIRIAAAS